MGRLEVLLCCLWVLIGCLLTGEDAEVRVHPFRRRADTGNDTTGQNAQGRQVQPHLQTDRPQSSTRAVTRPRRNMRRSGTRRPRLHSDSGRRSSRSMSHHRRPARNDFSLFFSYAFFHGSAFYASPNSANTR